MFLKRFSQKAIGISLQNSKTLRYALIGLKSGKISVEKASEIDLHCKAALHRLQQLLRRYPSCLCIRSNNFLSVDSPRHIKSTKDQQEIVKNKIESLINSEKVALSCVKSSLLKTLSYICIKESELQWAENKLQDHQLFCDKMVSSVELMQELGKGTRLFFSEDQIELVHLNSNGAFTFGTINSKEAPPQTLLKKIELKMFELNLKAPIHISCLGLCQSYEELICMLQEKPFIELHFENAPFSVKEHATFNYEILAARHVFDLKGEGLRPLKYSSFFKIYKRPILTHAIGVACLTFLCMLFWSFQAKRYELINSQALSASLEMLGPRIKQPLTSSIDLQKWLFIQEKKSPKVVLSPNIKPISETLAWLSSLSQKPSWEQKGGIVIERFDYSLQGKKAKTTGVIPLQIKLVFKATSASEARDFYEKITSQKQWVDSSKKIDWAFKGGAYHLSFFLKPPSREGRL